MKTSDCEYDLRFGRGGIYWISSFAQSISGSASLTSLWICRRERPAVLRVVFDGEGPSVLGAGVWKAVALALVVLKPRACLSRAISCC
jgi:hypothetical protein